MHHNCMSDKEIALDSIQRLPADARLDTIAERLEFLAAIRKGFDQIERDKTVPHEEVKRQLAAWLSESSCHCPLFAGPGWVA
jgi:predicted transcriptional regulator